MPDAVVTSFSGVPNALGRLWARAFLRGVPEVALRHAVGGVERLTWAMICAITCPSPSPIGITLARSSFNSLTACVARSVSSAGSGQAHSAGRPTVQVVGD